MRDLALPYRVPLLGVFDELADADPFTGLPPRMLEALQANPERYLLDLGANVLVIVALVLAVYMARRSLQATTV